MLEHALDDLTGKDKVILAKDAEILNKADIIAKQDERFAKMLKILQDFASVEKAERKSFWKSVGKYLKEVVKTITDPTMIRTVIEIIAVARALEH